MYAHFHVINNVFYKSELNTFFFLNFKMIQPSPPCKFYVNIGGETQQIDKTSSNIHEPEISPLAQNKT